MRFMKKYTVIWNDYFQIGSNRHCLTKLQRVLTPSLKELVDSYYGQNAHYIFEGHPLLEGEKGDENWLTVVELPLSVIQGEKIN